jgi:hypothetical protein
MSYDLLASYEIDAALDKLRRDREVKHESSDSETGRLSP